MRYSEIQVTSALLDQEPFVGKPIKYFICTSPRSGSYLLCRHLVNAGLGVPHEYFNPIHMRQIADRFRVADPLKDGLGSYIAALIRRRTRNGIFAAKIQHWQYSSVLKNPAGHDVLRGGFFVYLTREDLLGQAISYHFARLTGRWGFGSEVTTEPWQGDFFDFEAIDQQLDTLLQEEQGWRRFFAVNGITPLLITYSDICKNPDGVVLEIAARLGVPGELVKLGYVEQPDGDGGTDPGIPSKREVYKAYLAARRSLT